MSRSSSSKASKTDRSRIKAMKDKDIALTAEHPAAGLKHIVRGIARRGLQPIPPKAVACSISCFSVIVLFLCGGGAFTTLFNLLCGTNYVPVEYRDAPDVRCVDSKGGVLNVEVNVEVTLTEDRPGDVKARLGRSEDRSLPVLKAHLAKVKASLADPLERVSCLNTNVGSSLVQRIRAKINKRYGPNTALVVRNTSGVDWDWDLVAGALSDWSEAQCYTFTAEHGLMFVCYHSCQENLQTMLLSLSVRPNPVAQ